MAKTRRVFGDITPIARPPEIDTAENREQLLEEDLRTSSATSTTKITKVTKIFATRSS
jgi:hypothetical protein